MMSRSASSYGERPWHILFILLIALTPATTSMFLYSFVMLSAAQDWDLTPYWAAVVGFLPMAARPFGGLIFGSLSDRYGRRNALLLSILLSAISAALSGLSLGPFDFGVYRLVLGMVMGGQWAVTMTLVSEIWHASERGRAVGIVQSGFPVGFIYASLIALWVAPQVSWRMLLIMGALPALLAAPLAFFTLKESSLWMADVSERGAETASFRELFGRSLLRNTILGTLVVFSGSFGAWSFNPWIPVYLGRLGAPSENIPLFTLWIMMGALAGYIIYGFISDRLGRKPTLEIFFVGMAVGLACFGFIPSRPWAMGEGGLSMVSIVLLGAFTAFFLGYFSGYGSLLAELFPTRIRSRGLGFCYCIGGIGAAIGPGSTGYLSSVLGLGNTFILVSLIFLGGALWVSLLPETLGKEL
jgi:MFS family permease